MKSSYFLKNFFAFMFLGLSLSIISIVILFTIACKDNSKKNISKDIPDNIIEKNLKNKEMQNSPEDLKSNDDESSCLQEESIIEKNLALSEIFAFDDSLWTEDNENNQSNWVFIKDSDQPKLNNKNKLLSDLSLTSKQSNELHDEIILNESSNSIKSFKTSIWVSDCIPSLNYEDILSRHNKTRILIIDYLNLLHLFFLLFN